jgi:hypothetical protein
VIYASAAAVVIALLALIGFRMWLGASGSDVQTRIEWMQKHMRELREIIDSMQRLAMSFEKRLGHVEAIACELESKPTVDLSKHDAAVVNLGKQLKELAAHVDKEIKRVQSSQAAVAISGRRIVS